MIFFCNGVGGRPTLHPNTTHPTLEAHTGHPNNPHSTFKGGKMLWTIKPLPRNVFYFENYIQFFSFTMQRLVFVDWAVGDYFEMWLVNNAASANDFNFVLFQAEVSWHPNP